MLAVRYIRGPIVLPRGPKPVPRIPNGLPLASSSSSPSPGTVDFFAPTYDPAGASSDPAKSLTPKSPLRPFRIPLPFLGTTTDSPLGCSDRNAAGERYCPCHPVPRPLFILFLDVLLPFSFFSLFSVPVRPTAFSRVKHSKVFFPYLPSIRHIHPFPTRAWPTSIISECLFSRNSSHSPPPVA